MFIILLIFIANEMTSEISSIAEVCDKYLIANKWIEDSTEI